MLDQVEALKWVQQNIRAFGGDPAKVTIFGLSAGAASVGLQLLSPLSKGLFHRAISESGTALSPWATYPTARAAKDTKFLALLMKCLKADSEKRVHCLRRRSAKNLVEKSTAAILFDLGLGSSNIAWSPVVDNDFLLEAPKASMEAGNFSKVPYLAGVTTHEFSIFYKPRFNNITPLKFETFLLYYAMRKTGNLKNAYVVYKALHNEYKPRQDTSSDLRKAVIDLFTDERYVTTTTEDLLLHSKSAPAFMFLFSHVSKMSKFPAWMGARHGDSTLYSFGVPFLYPESYDDTDRNVSAFMMQTFTNFAKTGKPTPEAVSGVQWSQFTASKQTYVNINGASPEVGKNYRSDKVAFWSRVNSMRPRAPLPWRRSKERWCRFSLPFCFPPYFERGWVPHGS